MKTFKANTIHELRIFKCIKIKEIWKIISKQTYYNLIRWRTKPTKKIIDKICLLFDIDEKTFKKLLKKTLSNN